MALKYRHELKYVVSAQQIAVLRSRIRYIMDLDEHVGEEGKYTIRSAYFDDYRNTCYFENENGTSPREKFRIRIYDASDKEIHLELKRKDSGKTHKDSCSLTRGQCEAFLEGADFAGIKERIICPPVAEGMPEQNIPLAKGQKRLAGNEEKEYIPENYPPVFRKFCLKYQSELYRPKVIVEYDREPYICRNGNVRVTFDTNIRSSNCVDDFFEKKIFARPVMPSGYHLMEVKYDEFLPDYIYNGLQMENLQQATFSKYYLCRKYNIGGVRRNGI